MERYLVEVPHDADPWGCAKVVRIFLGTGSHYLAQADWGCADGNHSAWMIVEAENREEARQIVPPPLQEAARVVLLCKFTIDSLEEIMREHEKLKPS